MGELFVFKAGNYPQGEYTRARVRKLVEAYDPINDTEAPAVIGHRGFQLNDTDEDELAHGWVTLVRGDGAGKVFATFRDWSSKIRHYMTEKQLQYISVEIDPRDERSAELSPYLARVAFLGRSIPQISTTKIPNMFELERVGGAAWKDEETGRHCFARAVIQPDIVIFSRPRPTPTEEDTVDTNTNTVDVATLQKQLEEATTKIAAFETQLTALKGENETLKTSGQRTDSATHFAKFRGDGKHPTPAEFDAVVAFDAKLPDEFRDEFRSFFEGQKPLLDLSGAHFASKEGPKGEGDVIDQIRAFATEKNIKSFNEAARAFYKVHPEAFEGKE